MLKEEEELQNQTMEKHLITCIVWMFIVHWIYKNCLAEYSFVHADGTNDD